MSAWVDISTADIIKCIDKGEMYLFQKISVIAMEADHE